MNENELNINKGLEIVNDAKEFEKNGFYDQAAQAYNEAKNFFGKINENKLSAQCLVAHASNMIKFYLAARDIEDFSENLIDAYIHKIYGITNMEINKLDKYTILIEAYQELEKVFEATNMVDYKNKMFYMKKRLYHKLYWQKAIQKKRKWKSRMKDISNACLYRYIDSFCGHGDSPIRAAIWIAGTIIVFSAIFKVFNLIKFTDPEKTVCFFQSLYFSVVTFTTLGYGDIVPIGSQGQLLISIEVFLGYFMLGTLIALFINKLQR